jgi:hypothetical protein
LCEALYPTLDALEIALRNTIHSAATTAYNTEFWFDRPGVLIKTQPHAIRAARDALTRRSAPVSAGRIVAELHFSFWTYLLSSPYDRQLWQPTGYRLLREAFPQIPFRQRTRKTIHGRYDSIRRLRNRVFHYEPLWDRTSLAQDHLDILEAIGWVSLTLRDTVHLLDRFPAVLADGPQALERRLTKHLMP